MHNMCYAKVDAVEALDAASVGAFAFVGKDGRPRACPVTPYVYDGEAVVSSTLAFTAKVAAVRRDPRVALLAGGCLVRGRATLDVDLTSKAFDERVRHQELRKYPPSRQILAIPGHRRLLWWYVGRASIAIPLGDCTSAPGSDRVTVTFLDGGLPRIVPLDPGTDVSSDEIPVPLRHEGPACLLVHDEEPDMADLRQLTLHGVVRDGIFRAERRTGSLDPSHPGPLDQLRTLRALGRAARKNRPVLARWARETCG
jgi:Pyridoxamine 5'-phosphate oxidase